MTSLLQAMSSGHLKFCKFLNKARLVFELPLTYEEFESMADMVAQELTIQRLVAATRILEAGTHGASWDEIRDPCYWRTMQ